VRRDRTPEHGAFLEMLNRARLVRWPLLLLVVSVPAGAETFVFEGEVPDGGSFFTIPFTVAPGTKEIEVRHDDLSSANILDWGLLMPDGGFRGWGGGNSEPAVVGETSASRSYLAGPLTPGTWEVLVGKAFVPQAPAKYRVEVETRDTASLGPQPRQPYAPASLSKARRWYAGDLHVHSRESGDARPSLDEIASLAESRGLDFVALSDHNTVSQLDFIGDAQPRHPTMLFVPSIEFTTYAGHLGAFGATVLPPFWLGFRGVDLNVAIDDLASTGGVVTINHPTLDLGTLCIGCAWKHPLRNGEVRAIEVGVGGYDETGVLFDASAIAFWEGLAERGLHLAPVGGSDDHRAGVGSNQTQSAIGSPTTMIEAAGLSPAELVQGLREFRSVVKLRGPGDPMIFLEPRGGLGGFPGFAGNITASEATIRATVTGGKGHTLAWIENGALVGDEEILSDPYVSDFAWKAVVGEERRLRAEVRVAGTPRTLTSHLWLTVAPGPLGQPAKADFEQAPSCLGCASAGGTSTLILLALWALRRKPFTRSKGERK
jgi:hypothetical protein